jgi:hypothetical protein
VASKVIAESVCGSGVPGFGPACVTVLSALLNVASVTAG